MKRTLLCLLAILTFQTIQAAEAYYAIHLGTYANPRLEDFKHVKPMGFLYAEQEEGETYRVFLGDYGSASEAERVAGNLKEKGFWDAFVVEQKLSFGQSAAVIQLASYAPNDRIKWSRYFELGNVYVLAQKTQIKVVTGPYRNMNDAKASLSSIRRQGFVDAFPKIINSTQLHKVGTFEVGEDKQPLIPIQLDGSASAQVASYSFSGDTVREKGIPGQMAAAYEAEAAQEENIPEPRIRTNVKRRSALDLQATLKEMESYKGSIDGLYGPATARAYESAANSNRQFQQYKLLAQHLEAHEQLKKEKTSPLQSSINNLWTQQDIAFANLQSYNYPVSKAYQAYWLYMSNGTGSSAVDRLMNEAIREAFTTVAIHERPPLDVQATYTYDNIDQIVRHMTYVHHTDTNINMPCWLFERHANEVRGALTATGGLMDGSVQACYSFDKWEVVKVLKTIAADLNSDTELDEAYLATMASMRSQFYLSPTALEQNVLEELYNWNNTLWQNLDAWAVRDPLHGKINDALKLSYYQTQVQLEDHYMDRGFGPTQAKGLSLVVLRSLVDYHLARFM